MSDKETSPQRPQYDRNKVKHLSPFGTSDMLYELLRPGDVLYMIEDGDCYLVSVVENRTTRDKVDVDLLVWTCGRPGGPDQEIDPPHKTKIGGTCTGMAYTGCRLRIF